MEIDDKARGVMRHRFPEMTLFSDVCEVTADDLLGTGFVPERGVLTAGFPCQDVSIAGHRAGLAGHRTRLFFEIIRIAADLKPKWFLLENVPGLLNSNGGRDMGTVVGALSDIGFGVAWRVLDAQYFGVPQRRRRVFLAGCLGDLASAGEVLLDPEGGGGNLAASGRARQTAPRATQDGPEGGGGLLVERGVVQAITSSLATGGADAQHAQAGWLIPTGNGNALLPNEEAAGGRGDAARASVGTFPEEKARTLTTRIMKGINTTVDEGAIVFQKIIRPESAQRPEVWAERDIASTRNLFDVSPARAVELVLEPVTVLGDKSHALTAEGFDASEDGTGRGWPTVTSEWGVRRLTPRECERLQGFDDDHTLERWDYKTNKVVEQSDSARGHQVGNAVAVPVVAWIGHRIVANDS